MRKSANGLFKQVLALSTFAFDSLWKYFHTNAAFSKFLFLKPLFLLYWCCFLITKFLYPPFLTPCWEVHIRKNTDTGYVKSHSHKMFSNFLFPGKRMRLYCFRKSNAPQLVLLFGKQFASLFLFGEHFLFIGWSNAFTECINKISIAFQTKTRDVLCRRDVFYFVLFYKRNCT